MKHSFILMLFIMAFLFNGSCTMAQSVEAYAGHQRTGVDLMWFRYVRKEQGENTRFLFFSRNRASIDYQNEAALLGSVNAISYNFNNGIGMVGVGTFTADGFTPKAGIQLFKQQGDFMFFGWLVAETTHHPGIDLFGLFRYQPTISEHWKLFLQVELFPVWNTLTGHWNITERCRIGPKFRQWSGGLMLDGNQSGRQDWFFMNNAGGFLRYDF